MTLIIALNCKDGIVVASDGQATSGSSGGPIKRKIQKIFKLGDNVVFGASGSVGTIQKSRDIIQQFSQQLNNGLDINTREQIRQQLFQIMRSELERHKTFHGKPEGAPLSDTLICVRHNDGSCKIWHIAPDCADEFLEELGYGCSGIGDTFAHTLLKNYYNNNLDIQGGKLVAFRIIKEAIEIGAYGLGEPIDIWALNKKDGIIEQITKEEIMALNDACLSWKETESAILGRILNKEGGKNA